MTISGGLDHQCSSKHFKSFWLRNLSFFNRVLKHKFRFWGFESFHGVFAITSLFTFLLTISCAYMYLFPILHPFNPIIIDLTESIESVKSVKSVKSVNNASSSCNVFDGRWIRDDDEERYYPLYNASKCPFLEQGFNCIANGRTNIDYTKWKWKPRNCEAVPRLKAVEVLETFRGKRIVFVGDSLSRTQWESMICLLMMGVDDVKTVYEINGNEISKQIRFLGVRFGSFDLRVDFYRSVFLVKSGSVPRNSPRRVKSSIVLDKLDDVSKEWVDADVLVFNSGHWWTPTKLFEMGSYFQAGGSLKLGMPIASAFRMALDTWAYWVENNINTNRTRVFFRTFEPSHWSGRKQKSCIVTRDPLSSALGKDESQISDIIFKVVTNMSVPVSVLHVTPMGSFRSDAHVGTWSDNPSVPDCSHWCLPGVPDVWNQILFMQLRKQTNFD